MSNTFKNYLAASVTTQATVYTVPALTQSTVIGMNIANTTASLASVSVRVATGGAMVYVVKSAPVPAGGALVPIGGDQKLVLEAGDYISVASDNAVDVILSTLEIA